MEQTKGFSEHDATVATIIGSLVSLLFRLVSNPGLCLTFPFSGRYLVCSY